MNRIVISIILLLCFTIGNTEEYVESFNVLSEDYVHDIQDASVIRNINGGTVIIPQFDESCPEEMKTAFVYACKIVEEYMPPCLPITVSVSCGRINGTSSNSISKISTQTKEHFGNCERYSNSPMSTIKGVILGELGYDSDITYLRYVPSIDFFKKDPDIRITYNMQKLDDISFSLSADPDDKYDFVSVAIRDLLIGLGINHSFKYDKSQEILVNPERELTPFEVLIDNTLGNKGNNAARLIQATKGQLTLKLSSGAILNLYAPSPWQNGTSLKYFIPKDGCCVSKILSYNFCKGMVTRDLSDSYSHIFFYDFLGWKLNYLTSSSTPTLTSAGSTTSLMPYNGTISFNEDYPGLESSYDPTAPKRSIQALSIDDDDDDDPYEKYLKWLELEEYVNKFHPYSHESRYDTSEGATISILKKDGTWDLVQFLNYHVYGLTFNMDDWEFHYEDDEYARTIDGYLRARVTTKNIEYGRINFKSTFFVVDYLPQKVNLSYAYINTPSTQSTQASTQSIPVRIFFSNLEGIDRLVLENLREGFRVPGKIIVTDFKKGYYDTTIDRSTTFTAIGYNDNGTSRGVPITITYPTENNESSIKFRLSGNVISILSSDNPTGDYLYTITPINSSSSKIMQTGATSGSIDISNLTSGLFILNIVNKKTGQSESFKFTK